MHQDRRREPRRPLLLQVRFEGAAEASSASGESFTGDLSPRGAFIFTREPPPVGTVVTVDVGFPGLLPTETLRGVVRWVRPQDPFAHAALGGFGVEWDEPLSSERLRRLVEGEPEVLDLVEVAAEDEAIDGAELVEVPTFRVLVADDSAHARDVVKRTLLHGAGARDVYLEVVEVGDGAAAWQHLQSAPVDLLIVDVYMPVLDGRALLQLVRATPMLERLPVVVCSAGGPDTREIAEELGAAMYLQKPVRMQALLETVYRLLPDAPSSGGAGKARTG